jgi:hypothetical protein
MPLSFINGAVFIMLVFCDIFKVSFSINETRIYGQNSKTAFILHTLPDVQILCS